MSEVAVSRLRFLGPLAPRSNIDLARLGVVAALIGLIVFGALRLARLSSGREIALTLGAVALVVAAF